MAAEVVVTSAPRGVKLGRTGFQVVMRTAGMREDVTGTLEQLGDYRHVHPQGSGRNPTIYTFRRVRSFIGELSALVRSVDAGNDFSGRSNKLTHVVALGAAEIQSLGRATPPALLAALESDGTLVSAWPGGPEERPSGPRLPSIASEARRCDRWAEQTGDAGWAGVIAERALRGAATLVVAPDCSPASSRMVLDLFDEVYALLPPSRRWEIPFDTTLVAAGSPATLRGTYAGSPESATPGTALVVELAGRPPIPPEFETSDLVAAARTGAARLGPATGRASSGPRPPGPLPVPGGPPLGPSLGHPEGSDPLGFDNLLTGAGIGPPPIPGGPPAPPLPTKGIGHRVGDSARDGDEDAEPRYRNPAMLSAVIVASLLLIMALGIVVYAAIKLHQRQNAIKALSEIAKAEPAAAANPDEPAKKQGESPLALVNKALWPNTDWWYFLDPVSTSEQFEAKVPRFVSLLKTIKKKEDLTHEELLALWRSWEKIAAWNFSSISELEKAAVPLINIQILHIPEGVDSREFATKVPEWKHKSEPLVTPEGVESFLKSLVVVATPKHVEKVSRPNDGPRPPDEPIPDDIDSDLKVIVDYLNNPERQSRPTGEHWRKAFPVRPSDNPFNINIAEFGPLFESVVKRRREELSTLDPQLFAERFSNQVIHNSYLIFKKEQSGLVDLSWMTQADLEQMCKAFGLTRVADSNWEQQRTSLQDHLNQSLINDPETKNIHEFLKHFDIKLFAEWLGKEERRPSPHPTRTEDATAGSSLPEEVQKAIDRLSKSAQGVQWNLEGKVAFSLSLPELLVESTFDLHSVEGANGRLKLFMDAHLKQMRCEWLTDDKKTRESCSLKPILITSSDAGSSKSLTVWIAPRQTLSYPPIPQNMSKAEADECFCKIADLGGGRASLRKMLPKDSHNLEEMMRKVLGDKATDDRVQAKMWFGEEPHGSDRRTLRARYVKRYVEALIARYAPPDPDADEAAANFIQFMTKQAEIKYPYPKKPAAVKSALDKRSDDEKKEIEEYVSAEKETEELRRKFLLSAIDDERGRQLCEMYVTSFFPAEPSLFDYALRFEILGKKIFDAVPEGIIKMRWMVDGVESEPFDFAKVMAERSGAAGDDSNGEINSGGTDDQGAN